MLYEIDFTLYSQNSMRILYFNLKLMIHIFDILFIKSYGIQRFFIAFLIVKNVKSFGRALAYMLYACISKSIKNMGCTLKFMYVYCSAAFTLKYIYEENCIGARAYLPFIRDMPINLKIRFHKNKSLECSLWLTAWAREQLGQRDIFFLVGRNLYEYWRSFSISLLDMCVARFV